MAGWFERWQKRRFELAQALMPTWSEPIGDGPELLSL